MYGSSAVLSQRAIAPRLAASVLFLVLAMVACAPRSSAVAVDQGPAHNDPVAERLLDLVNQERAHGAVCGGKAMPPAPRLSLERRLVRAAQLHTADQAKRNVMSHVGKDGSTVGQRVSRAGYEWSLVAENVAWGYDSPEDVVRAWMNSPAHCESIMRAEERELGAAELRSFWTLVFATPR
jgi:uncharacterized protein YkwD